MTFNVYHARYCPACGCDSEVIDSRTSDKGEFNRRRKCINPKCNLRWNTKEVIVKVIDIKEVTK